MSLDKTHNQLYSKVALLLQTAKTNIVRTVNHTMVYTYYEIGRMIVEEEQQGKERAEYGKQLLKALSGKLTTEFGKGYSEDNLGKMKKFYLTYSKQIALISAPNAVEKDIIGISATPLRKSETEKNNAALPFFRLSWSHYLKLMRIEDDNERSFYEIECVQNNWSLKELDRQFDTALYERLALSRDKAKVTELAAKGQIIEKPKDLLKDPYILEFLQLPDSAAYSETDLETAIINTLEHFLLELGKGFTFAGRQVRISFDEKHFRVDLVFYNRLLKCFVLVDLKIGVLSHQDLGQMQMYVNYYDRFVKLPDENKTIGIVLCKDKNDTLVEITLPEANSQIFASKYKTILPDKDTLRALIDQNE